MGWPAWKSFEKEVGMFFGGHRHVRINRAEVHGDIDNVGYSIECKYGKQIPQYLDVDVPTVLEVGTETFRLVPSTFLTVADGVVKVAALGWRRRRKPNVRFLIRAMDQAEQYSDKPALVCVKPRHRHGFVCIWREVDLNKGD